MAKICLVACASSKVSCRSQARDLYSSELFSKSRRFAATFCDRWYILSAKYGLLDPMKVVEPYEMTLNTMPSQVRKEWAAGVFKDLSRCTQPKDQITFLAGKRYREELVPMLQTRGNEMKVPLANMGIGKQVQWLQRVNRNPERIQHITRFYKLLSVLEGGLDGKRVLGNCCAKKKWPEAGVYFFFEPGEMRTLEESAPRVVRVGTHRVSGNSKTKLWDRLRAHRGNVDGGGNHRGSIFRLHTGTALRAREGGNLAIPTWGEGQSASKEVKGKERPLEESVSLHLGCMSLLWLAVADKAGPDSDRAYLERNAIALLSGKRQPLDVPGPHWLGNRCPHDAVRESGLWNVNHVDQTYDPRFLDIMETYVKATLTSRHFVYRSE